MAKEIKIEGNYLVIFDNGTGAEEVRWPAGSVVPKFNGDNFDLYQYQPTQIKLNVSSYDGTTIVDNRTGLVFADLIAFKTFISDNTGYFYNGSIDQPLQVEIVGGGGAPNTNEIVFVASKTDLPTAVAGVITLLANVTYYFTGNVDLTGDRLLAGANTTILGASSENCSITSTGLATGANDFLLYSDYTLPIRHITFKNVQNAIGINTQDQGAQPIALDWTGVNFSGCVENLVCGDIDNFIFSKGAVLGSGRFWFLGTVGTIGIDNSIFVGSGSSYNMIDLSANCVVTRRFRVIYSSFVAFGSTVAISTDANSTIIPVDSYVLDTCNFSGGGTYLQGIGQFFTDNEPRFVNNKGIVNTSAVGNYYMLNNGTATIISTVATPVKILGTTVANAINQKFTHTNNRLTYVGELVKDFEVSAVASFTGAGQNKLIGLYVAKKGTVLTESEMYATTDGNNKAQSIAIQTITDLTNNDYLEIWIENNTDDTNVTVEFLNVIVKALN